MKRFRNPALLLAAALQVLPICRTIVPNPAVPSTFAIVFRWAIGATAAVGVVDAVSGQSQVRFACPTNATGYVGQFFSFTITLAGTIGSDPGAKINAIPLPPGLTNYTYDGYNQQPPNVYGVISGVPTTAVTNFLVHLNATHPSYSQTPTTNLYLTMLPLGPPVAPQITSNPASTNVLAGGKATFSVTAGGTPPLKYQWRRYSTNVLANATNASLALTNVRVAHAGDYTLVITNSVGSITSTVAKLTVTVPPGPSLSPVILPDNKFRFSFIPIVGLTNTVLTNVAVADGGWGVFTTIPPPQTAASITVTDAINSELKFYRVRFDP